MNVDQIILEFIIPLDVSIVVSEDVTVLFQYTITLHFSFLSAGPRSQCFGLGNKSEVSEV